MKTKYTNKQLAEFLMQSVEQDVQEFNEKYCREIALRLQMEKEKKEQNKLQLSTETVPS
ncbi:MAG: hypothetical protein LBP87_15805 [Planctomycetaceae bacterium]|jgi:wobble nucleotide-excising tRNase|nr:hypothetical protein [Planctomycetaceae bacterium]